MVLSWLVATLWDSRIRLFSKWKSHLWELSIKCWIHLFIPGHFCSNNTEAHYRKPWEVSQFLSFPWVSLKKLGLLEHVKTRPLKGRGPGLSPAFTWHQGSRVGRAAQYTQGALSMFFVEAKCWAHNTQEFSPDWFFPFIYIERISTTFFLQ